VRRRVARFAISLAIVTVAAASQPGCSSDTQGTAQFCASAAALFDSSDPPPSNGAGLVADMRRINLEGLSTAERDAFSSAVEQIDDSIRRFNSGAGSDGWSTMPAVAVASRICEIELPTYQVTP
jgi:hypothetical protein